MCKHLPLARRRHKQPETSKMDRGGGRMMVVVVVAAGLEGLVGPWLRWRGEGGGLVRQGCTNSKTRVKEVKTAHP